MLNLLTIIGLYSFFKRMINLPAQNIIKKSGTMCYIGGIWGSIHEMINLLVEKLNLTTPSFITDLLSNYHSKPLCICFYLSSIILGIMVVEMNRTSNKISLILAIGIIQLIWSSIITIFLSPPISTTILLFSILLVFGTIKQYKISD